MRLVSPYMLLIILNISGLYSPIEKKNGALIGWLSWLEYHPAHKKFGGLIPGRGTYLGWGFDPQSR